MPSHYLAVPLLTFLSVAACFTPAVIGQGPVEVEIRSVDVGRRSLNVEYGGKTRSLSVAPEAAILVSGRPGGLREVLPGDQASVVYDREKSVITRIEARRGEVRPADKPDRDGRWDEMDERLIFLMVRLASLEASLDAIDQALLTANTKSGRKSSVGNRADRANEDMDRKGGGPLKWSLFYGMTAEKFFYHPVDPNTSYHTVTVLSQQGPQADNKVGGGVPASQGLPVHQRPPQFDYIYRANESAKARAQAEVAEIRGNINTLVERRARLEAEQASLWVGIAFRSLSHYDLDKKPLYRFEPQVNTSDPSVVKRTDVMKAAVEFMRLALSIMTESERDQAAAFSRIRPAVVAARQRLSDEYLKLSVDVLDGKSAEGRFVQLAKRLEDVASNLSDSYIVAREGDQARDQQRKETFRAMLQTSLISYAQIVLALDEMAIEMQNESAFKADSARPYAAIDLSVRSSTVVPSINLPMEAAEKRTDEASSFSTEGNTIDLLVGKLPSLWESDSPLPPSNWRLADGVLTCLGEGPSIMTKAKFDNFDLHLEFSMPPEASSGVFLRGRYEVQLLDQQYRSKDGRPVAEIANHGAIYGSIAPSEIVYLGPNKWNSMDVRLEDRNVTVVLNGKPVIKNQMIDKTSPAALDRNESAPGVILLQASSIPGIRFRNASITPRR